MNNMKLLKKVLGDVVVMVVFGVIWFGYLYGGVNEGGIVGEDDGVGGMGCGGEMSE